MKTYFQPQTEEITLVALAAILGGSPTPVPTQSKVGSNYVNGGDISGNPSNAM